MNKDKRHQIFSRLQQANPAPTTELAYNSPFELLIAVILSAQATDVSVNLAHLSRMWHRQSRVQQPVAMVNAHFLRWIRRLLL